jgi:hypothetical protein
MLQSISVRSKYEDKSFEELRFEDFCNGSPVVASGFGSPSWTPAASTDGTAMFGAPPTSCGSGSFGRSSSLSASSGGLIGSSDSAPVSTASNSTGSLFGSSSEGGFFSSSTRNASPTGGTFGGSTTAASSGGLFGSRSSTTAATASGGSLFGSSSQGDLFSGSTSTAGELFGSATTACSPTGGLFGESSGGLFGSSTSTHAAAASTGSPFRSSSQRDFFSISPTGGLFGREASPSGTNAATSTSTTTSTTTTATLAGSTPSTRPASRQPVTLPAKRGILRNHGNTTRRVSFDVASTGNPPPPSTSRARRASIRTPVNRRSSGNKITLQTLLSMKQNKRESFVKNASLEQLRNIFQNGELRGSELEDALNKVLKGGGFEENPAFKACKLRVVVPKSGLKTEKDRQDRLKKLLSIASTTT